MRKTALLIPHREKNEDGKSLKNPEAPLSKAYEEFPDPLSKGREGGFDIHIYHFQVHHAQLLSNTTVKHPLISTT